MAELKTRPTKASVAQFIAKMPDAMRADAKRVAAMMTKATRAKPEMWGKDIVGFGRFQYRKNGAEWMQLGFAPRSGKLSLYLWEMWEEKALVKKIGDPPTGMGCMYVKRLSDLDEKGLAKLMAVCVKRSRAFTPK